MSGGADNVGGTFISQMKARVSDLRPHLVGSLCSAEIDVHEN